jgi:hypothetical protein
VRAKLPEDLREALTELASARGEAWDGVCGDFARVIGCLQLLTDTGVFILHGPLTALGQRFCDGIIQAAHGLMPALGTAGLRVMPSTLGDDAGCAWGGKSGDGGLAACMKMSGGQAACLTTARVFQAFLAIQGGTPRSMDRRGRPASHAGIKKPGGRTAPAHPVSGR